MFSSKLVTGVLSYVELFPFLLSPFCICMTTLEVMMINLNKNILNVLIVL